MSLFKQNEYCYRVTFFSTELNFLKGDTNIYFEYITLFEKKKKFFTEKKIFFVKIIHIFFLKTYIFFQIVLLRLNNHIHHDHVPPFPPTVFSLTLKK